MLNTNSITKEVKRNRANKDYDMFLNGQYVGSRETYTAAQTELDRIAYEQLSH